MLVAILGDIVGSRYEWHNVKSKSFELLTHHCRPTDDSVMTLAIANALLACDGEWKRLEGTVIRTMQDLGNAYPDAGYGGSFVRWLSSADPKPYNSWGNGAAMRVSPCAWAATSLDEALRLSETVTVVTHNHPEGIKGAAAVTAALYLARTGSSILDIRDHLVKNYYPLAFTLDDIRPGYAFDVSCQGSVPQALEAFLESTSFEDAIRNAVSIGGDSDTIAAITGSIAEAYYGIPGDLRRHALTFLDERQLSILNAFEAKYGTSLEKSVGGKTTRKADFRPDVKVAKLDGEDGIRDLDYSLNAGRYVGVVIEDDGMSEAEFAAEMAKMNEELRALGEEARRLEGEILGDGKRIFK